MAPFSGELIDQKVLKIDSHGILIENL